MISLLSDNAIQEIANDLDFLEATKEAFIDASFGSGHVAPLLRATGVAPGQGINIKFGATGDLVGGKIGTYWAGNASKGMPNHEATTILLDPESGFISAIISARLLNRLRTAAADAVAVDLLARPDAKNLALIGAGAQAAFEARAVAKVRKIDTIFIAARDAEKASAFVNEVNSITDNIQIVDPETACRAADMIITATPAQSFLVHADWVQPGTHVSAMGCDAKGKQEIDPALFGLARIFTDLTSQSIQIDECQHAIEQGIIEAGDIIELGAVLKGTAKGRQSASDITLFDSSGIAIQDLHIAGKALELASAQGLLTEAKLI